MGFHPTWGSPIPPYHELVKTHPGLISPEREEESLLKTETNLGYFIEVAKGKGVVTKTGS